MNFGEKIKAYRKERGMTQSEFGKLVGMSVGVVGDYEKGRRKVSLKIADRVAERTNTNKSYWIDVDEIDIKQFQALRMVIDALYKVGDIDKMGNMSPKAEIMLMDMLKSEVKDYILNQNRS